MSPVEPVTSTLAEFAAGTTFDGAPASAQHAAHRTFVNVVALATGAARRPSVELAFDLHRRLGSAPRFSVIGRDEKLGLFAAPFINGMSAHVDDYDDTHLPTIVHPGAPIAPAALAAAELSGASGADTMAGILAGVEVGLRVADGVCPEHLERGWHPTGTGGHIGAAAAASRVLGLDAEQTQHALAIAVNQAAGLLTVNGTMTKAFHPGKAAANGLEAALLAQRGVRGSTTAIEGEHGFARATSPKVDLARMVGELGTRWEIEKNAIKPYACGIVSHAAIDAARTLRTQLPVDRIDHVDVRVPQIVLSAMGIEDPKDALETKFSVYHCVTVGLLDGAGGPPQFSDERAVAPDVRALRSRVRTIIDQAVPTAAVELTVVLDDGREFREDVLHATASAERPMTDEELDVKVRGLLEPVLGSDGADRVIRLCGDLPEAAGVDELFQATRW